MRLTIIITAAVLALSVSSASAEMTTFYGPNGRYVGTAISNGRTTTFFSGSQYEGSSTRLGRRTNFYDRQGRYSGTVLRRR